MGGGVSEIDVPTNKETLCKKGWLDKGGQDQLSHTKRREYNEERVQEPQ